MEGSRTSGTEVAAAAAVDSQPSSAELAATTGNETIERHCGAWSQVWVACWSSDSMPSSKVRFQMLTALALHSRKPADHTGRQGTLMHESEGFR